MENRLNMNFSVDVFVVITIKLSKKNDINVLTLILKIICNSFIMIFKTKNVHLSFRLFKIKLILIRKINSNLLILLFKLIL